MAGDRIQVDGVTGLQSALRAIPGAAQTTADRSIADWATATQGHVQAAGRSSDRLSRMVSRSVRAQRLGREGSSITAGGSARLPTGTGSYGDVFFGAEFGGGSRAATRQFRPWRPRGYWFFPTIEQAEDTTLIDAAETGLDAAASRWAD